MPDQTADAGLRTIFAGTPEFAASILTALLAGPFVPELVLTQPDRRKGRGRKVALSPVKALVLEHDLELLQPPRLRDAGVLAALRALQPDVLIVAAYGLILPREVLAIPRFGCINVHASLLPRWRGAAPVERAIIAGDKTTGASIMQMDEGLDTGPVYAQREVPIGDDASAAEIEQAIAGAGATALEDLLQAFAACTPKSDSAPTPEPQDDSLATYAPKLTAADRTLDWTDANAAARRIRALADRLPVTVEIDDIAVQLLAARASAAELDDESVLASADPSADPPADPPANASTTPGTIVRADKSGIYFQCATGELQVASVKVNRGKGSVLDAAAAINGFAEYFRPGRIAS